jgi:hypothetical protein
MNCRTNIARVLAAAAAVLACVGVVPLSRAQVPTGPIAPLKKMEFKTVDPLGGAKLPSAAPGAGPAYPGGAAGRPAAGRKAGSVYYSDAAAGHPAAGRKTGSDYYSDAAASQQTGVRGGGPGYSCPGTARQPIRGRGGFRQY